jgi:hypothetical protein
MFVLLADDKYYIHNITPVVFCPFVNRLFLRSGDIKAKLKHSHLSENWIYMDLFVKYVKVCLLGLDTSP